MTGSEICSCLSLIGKTGFPDVNNTDETTAANIIICGWPDCPYADAAALIAACEMVFPEIQAYQTSIMRRKELSALDPLIAQIQRYEILGQDSTQSRAKLVAAMAEIDEKCPQPTGANNEKCLTGRGKQVRKSKKLQSAGMSE